MAGHNVILESRLEAMCKALNTMADTVDENLRRCRRALDGNTDVAPLASIDEAARQTRERFLMLMTREQPRAGDLRFIMAALRIEHDYERIEELVETFHERGVKLRQAGFNDLCEGMRTVLSDILELHQRVRTTWACIPASEAAARTRAEVKAAVPALVERINKDLLSLQERTTETIAAHRSGPDLLIELVLACRHLKRIAHLLTMIPDESNAFDRAT